MLTVAEALRIVLESSSPLVPRMVNLERALGCILAETVVADLDLPPFDKALMDGFAVRTVDFQKSGPHQFQVGEFISAGAVPSRPLKPGEAAVIMTGAPLPAGADCVVPHERTFRSGDEVISIPEAFREGNAVLHRAREMRCGEHLFEPGTSLDAIKLGVLASVGKASVNVVPRPRIVILPTGDELVPVNVTPGPGQIRESNSIILNALASPFGPTHSMTAAPDQMEGLLASLVQALDQEPDVLLVCGGVSAGQKDLVPGALRTMGFEAVFHKVKLRPGKPLLFARPDPAMSCTGSLVFGLPGNPVSGIIGFLLFVRPVLQKMLGQDPLAAHGLTSVELIQEFVHKGDRPTYHPARLLPGTHLSKSRVSPLKWAGSADLMTVARADGFIVFSEGERTYSAGELVSFLPLPRARA